MKLHLPKGLRSAVLACMAVVTGFATTVGTGVAVGGAMTIAFAASQAQAEVTTYTMADLVSKATTVSEGVVNVTDTHLGVTSYYIPAGHENAICGIADAELSAAIQSNTGYLTVAAWVCPDTLTGTQTVFSYGGQGDGFKLCLSGNQLKVTTKGAKDGALSGTTIGSDVLWTLVGVTLNLGDNSGTYLVGDQVTDCGPISEMDMKLPAAGGADDSFGIGIRNGATATEEGYQGMIAGLKVFYSTDAAITLSDLLAAMGEAPIMTYSGTNEFTWSGTSTFDGGVAFTTGADVRFTSTSAVVKLGENIQAGGIEIAGGVTMQTGAYKLTASKILLQGNLVLNPGAEKALSELLEANVSGAGVVKISGEGTKITAIDHAFDKLEVVVDGASIETGDAYFEKDVTLQNNALLTYTGTDSELFNWGTGAVQTISVLSGSKMELGTRRISLEHGDALVLDNGTITGTGDVNHDNSLVDICRSETIVTSTGISSIDAVVRITNNSNPTFQVDDGQLTITELKKGNFKKTGDGALVIGTLVTNGTLDVQAGTLQLNNVAEGYTVDNINVTSGATLKLMGAATAEGSYTVGGNLYLGSELALTGELTYVDGSLSDGTDGYRTAEYTIAQAAGTLELGADFAVSVNGENVTNYVIKGNKLVSEMQDTSNYWVYSSNLAYNAAKMGTAQVVQVENGASLVVADTDVAALNKVNLVAGASATVKQGDTALITFGGEFEKGTLSAAIGTDGAANSFNTANIAKDFTGSVTIESGSWEVNTKQRYSGGTTIKEGASLKIVGGSNNGAAAIRGTVDVLGGTLELAINDATGYGNGNEKVKVINLGSADAAGGTLYVSGGANQTMGNTVINMYGGTITDKDTEGNSAGKRMDLFGNGTAINVYSVNGTAEAPTESVIDISTLNMRQDDTALFVDSNAKLTIASTVGNGDNGNHNIVKNGGGELVIDGTYDATGSITVNAGTLTVTGTGNLTKGGDITLNGGTLDLLAGGTLTTGTKYINSGATLRAHATSAVRSTVQVNAGGIFEFADDGCKFTGITLKLMDAANLRLALDGADSGNEVKTLELGEGTNSVSIDTADAALAVDTTYTLLKYTNLTNVTADKFVLADTSLAGKYDMEFVLDETAKALTLTLRNKENALFWTGENTDANEWNTDESNTPWVKGGAASAFTQATYIANFDSSAAASERTVNIPAAVEAAAIYVTGTDWEWRGAGNITAGSLVVGGAEETKLTISTTGTKNFTNGVQISEGATLVVMDDSGWTGRIYGDGVLELQLGKTVDQTSTSHWLTDRLGTTDGSINTLRLSGNTVVDQQSTSNNSNLWLNAIDVLEIADGSCLAYNITHSVTYSTALKLAGDGQADNMAGALSLASHSSWIGSNAGNKSLTLKFSEIELTDDATIYVGKGQTANTATVEAAVKLNNHVLSINGGGTLILATTNSDLAGKVDVKAGTLAFKTSGFVTAITDATLVDGTGLVLFATAEGAKMTLESVKVNGESSVGLLQNSGCYNGIVELKAVTGSAEGTLKLSSGAQTDKASIINLIGTGTDVAEDSAFAGTIQLYGNAAAGGTQGRYVSMVISDGSMTASSVVDVNENSAGRHRLGIGINDDVVNVAGLKSQIADGSKLWIYSGAADCGDMSFTSDGQDRTLAINTAASTSYSTNATVLSDLNITKSGTGTQAFVGDMTAFDGDVTVNAGTLTIDNAAEDAAALAARTVSISDGAIANFADGLKVSNSLSSAGELSSTKITGAGAVTITGGTVTLSDTTDAFANTGDTTITGAELAGTWNADGVTIGEGTTVSGTIGLANSTINSTIENTGSIALSGSITVGVEGVIGESLYTHNGTQAADGNGYRSGTKDYALADTACTASDVTWLDANGNTITSAEFNNGTLTVAEDEDMSAYWVNAGTVAYDGSAATWNGTTETLGTGTVVKLNGGMLQLTGSIEAAASIVVEKASTIDVNAQTLNQSAISGTGAQISGSGTYNLGDDTGMRVGLADGWSGTVYKAEIDGGEAPVNISSYANANSMIEVDRVLCGSLAVNTGSLTINESLTIQTIMKAGARSGATSPLVGCLAVAGELAGDFDLVISEALLNTVLGVGESSGKVVLGTVGSKADDLAITLNGSGKYDLGESSFTLGWQEADGKQQLVLEGSIKGCEWIGEGGTALWISEDTSVDAFGADWSGLAWKGSEEPSADGENANFLGKGDSEVIIFGKVTPGHLRVDTTGSYTIAGGSISGSDVAPELAASGRLNLLTGTLNIEIGKASFGGHDDKGELVSSVVAAGAVLNIGDSMKSEVSINGGLELAGDATIANLSKLTVTEGGVDITGTLTVEGDRAMNNGTPDYSKRGTLVADSLTNNNGKVTVNGGVVQIGSDVTTVGAATEPVFSNNGTYEVKGGGLTTVLGDAENSGTLTLTDGSINITGNLDSTGGTLTLTKGDMTVGGELSGVDFDTIGADVKLSVGQYEDSTGLAIEGALTVTGESAIGSAITLGETGSLAVDGGSLTTGELKFGELTAESDAKVALSNDGSIAAPAITTFTTGAADGVLITLANDADGLVDGDSFRLVDGEDDAAGYRLADEYEQTVLLNALKAELLTDTEGMYLGVRAQTPDELVWNTSEDDSVGGLHIINDSDAPYHGYQTLDTILTVNVDADRTIDLSSIAPDDADDSLVINELAGTETLTITGNGDDRVTINGGEMTGGLDIADIDLQATDLTVGTLTGTTSEATTIGGDITVTKSADYIGGYDAATIAVTDGAVASLKADTGLTVAGDEGSITLNYDSDATINAIETTGADVNLAGAPDNKLTLAENSTMKGGSLNFDVKSDALGAEIIGGTLGLTDTAINVTQADDSLVIAGAASGTATTVIASLGDTTGGDVTLTGAGFDKYFTNARVENGNVVADRRTDYVKDTVNPESAGGEAGTTLLDDSLVNVNPQANRDKYATQADLLDAVDAGRMTDEDAAAVAGASVATLGMALSGDVERQLRAIRNRTTSMGVNECVVNEGMPYFNAWVNAEGNRGQLDKDGTLAGYSLDSWGGTVGFDVDFNPHFTAGLAITAMYGNLTADGPEAKAEGDMDTYYVTLFARYAEAAWTHTFVGTIGKMDGTFDRTVNAGGVIYDTEGSTDGMAFGLMYEVGYVMPLNEDASACLQPIFNVSLRHSNVGSYTEEGSDAGLEVGSQSMTVLTFGLGARMQAVVGESLYNRASIFEARALAKVDVGDRSSEADVAFIGAANGSSVESAELGAFGVELGAGLTIPVGDDDGSIFIDGSVELRSGYTNVNGTVGYRINF